MEANGLERRKHTQFDTLIYFLLSCKETIMKFTDLFVTYTVTGVHRAMQFHNRRLTFERKTTVINNKFCWGGCGGPERSS